MILQRNGVLPGSSNLDNAASKRVLLSEKGLWARESSGAIKREAEVRSSIFDDQLDVSWKYFTKKNSKPHRLLIQPWRPLDYSRNR